MDGAVHVVEICNHSGERTERVSLPLLVWSESHPLMSAQCLWPGAGMHAKAEYEEEKGSDRVSDTM